MKIIKSGEALMLAGAIIMLMGALWFSTTTLLLGVVLLVLGASLDRRQKPPKPTLAQLLDLDTPLPTDTDNQKDDHDG